MRYMLLVTLLLFAVFTTGCDTNGNLGHGWGVFGAFSQDSEGNGRGGSASRVVQLCDTIVEQRCFEARRMLQQVPHKDHYHWKWVHAIPECDRETIRGLLNNPQEDWRPSCYVIPADYECHPRWYYERVGNYVLDWRHDILLERHEMRACGTDG